ncbi:hypothetical protein B0H11DRAFT_1940121 [Mycena galericulata]|nr:hypothetical protein B0H11DRAFT_1940121 [Mycena galericulata]
MAPPAGQSIIPSHLDRAPSWPTSLPSLRSLLDYLAECEPIALYRAEFGRHFLNPREPYASFDPTAFRTNPKDEDDEVPFIALLFGRVTEAPLFQHGHSTFVVDAGPPEAAEAHAFFAGQLTTLAAPVTQGEEIDCENDAYSPVPPEFQSDTVDEELEVTDTIASVRLYVHGRRLDTDHREPPSPSVIHRRLQGIYILLFLSLPRDSIDPKDYELLARHLRVLPGKTFNIRHEAPSATHTASMVAPEISPPPPETTRRLRSHKRKRDHSVASDKEEAPQVATPSKRTRRKIDTFTPVTTVP